MKNYITSLSRSSLFGSGQSFRNDFTHFACVLNRKLRLDFILASQWNNSVDAILRCYSIQTLDFSAGMSSQQSFCATHFLTR